VPPEAGTAAVLVVIRAGKSVRPWDPKPDTRPPSPLARRQGCVAGEARAHVGEKPFPALEPAQGMCIRAKPTEMATEKTKLNEYIKREIFFSLMNGVAPAFWRPHTLREARSCGRVRTLLRSGDHTLCEKLARVVVSGLSIVLATCVATVHKGWVRACDL